MSGKGGHVGQNDFRRHAAAEGLYRLPSIRDQLDLELNIFQDHLDLLSLSSTIFGNEDAWHGKVLSTSSRALSI